MRVIGGELRSRTIKPVPGRDTRPTTDRVRESIASAVISARGEGFEGARVLDAFAGSGAMGIEALSRGAASCLFFDNNRKAAQTIRENLTALGLDRPRAVLRQADVLKARLQGPFDLVFMDPPYAYTAETVCGFINGLASSGALADGALLVYEHAADAFDERCAADLGEGLSLYSQKRHGTIGVSMMQYHVI